MQMKQPIIFVFGTLCCFAFTFNVMAQTQPAGALDRAFEDEAFFNILTEESHQERADSAFVYRVGNRHQVSIPVEKKAECSILPGGHRIYRIGFRSPGAAFMDLSFDRFHLPEGGYAYLYNPDTRHCNGPYFPEEISDSMGFSTDLLPGDRALLLCYVPASAKDSLLIRLRCIVAGQKSFFNSGETPACLINTACEEAEKYHDQVQSVVLIYMDGYLCSGTLLNNTAQDGTPYILTAAHCMEEISHPRYGSWKFFFNIASYSCASNQNGPALNDANLQVMTGCSLVAKGKNSDFLLLKLNRQIPESYNAYYSGWDRRNQAPSKGVAGIHHPKGDYKKISLSSQAPVTDNCSGVGFNRMAFWRFFWTKGMAFQGSSGSGLFESQNKRLVGTLTAINDVTCESSVDRRLCWYGKLSYHWFANNEEDPAQQLRPWLDPTHSGTLFLDGSYLRSSATRTVPEQEPQIRLYPNPASDAITLENEGSNIRSVKIYSISGQLLRTLPAESGTISLEGLPEGIHLMSVTTDRQTKHIRFTIIRH